MEEQSLVQGSERVAGELADAMEHRAEAVARRLGPALHLLSDGAGVLAALLPQVEAAADGGGVQTIDRQELVDGVKRAPASAMSAHSSMSHVVRLPS